MSQELEGKTILVTGATGFIGSRLVERLVMVEKAHVRALVHTPTRAVRIARVPVELVFGSVRDLKTIERASTGCQAVVHCAYGASGDAAIQRAVTVQGTRNVLQAAVAQGVERLVHMSTVRVHGIVPDGQLDEEAPLWCDEGDEYGAGKLEAELLVWRAWLDAALPVVILRPAIVYGPYSEWWAVDPVRRLKEGEFYLIDGGRGMCSPVYVDDMVQALVSALTRVRAVGEAFFIADSPVTWRQFYAYYLRMAGVAEVPSWDLHSWRAARSRRRFLSTLPGKVVAYLGSPRVRELAEEFAPLGSGLRLVRAILPLGWQERAATQIRELYRAKRWPASLPDELEMRTARSTCVYCTDKARELLDYAPVVSLEEGMRYTEDWLRYVGLL